MLATEQGYVRSMQLDDNDSVLTDGESAQHLPLIPFAVSPTVTWQPNDKQLISVVCHHHLFCNPGVSIQDLGSHSCYSGAVA